MKIRKLNEASEGFQKEFYNGYVILKNRAGDGWDIYSYEGTPEKVKRAVKEEGLATLKDAKATIDSWAGKASLNEGGYKITIEQDGKTFADYCYDYREESAIAQMKAKYGDNIEIKNIEAHNKLKESANAHFKVGDTFTFSGLYGGDYTSKVVAIHNASGGEYPNSIECETTWTNEDTGKTEVDTDVWNLTKDNEGNECIVIWEYAGQKGYVYPPSAQSNSSTVESSVEDKVKQDAKEMYEMGVACDSYEEFSNFMKQNGKTPTEDLYNLYVSTLENIHSKNKVTESLSDEQKAIVDKIADRYSTSKPVSGNWDTEAQHEMKAISKELNVSEDEAKSTMVNYLGFDASKLSEGIDGWDNRTGVIKRIDKYLSSNPEAVPPKGYIAKRTRAYDDIASRYGDYVTTPFGNISTDDLMQYARDNKLLDESKSTHCVYFTQDGMDQIEFEGSEDECNRYISDIQAEQDDEFGDEAPERFIRPLSEDKPIKKSLRYSQESFDKAYEFLKDATDNFTKEGRFKLPEGTSGDAAEDILADHYAISSLTGDSENPTYPEEVMAYEPISNAVNESVESKFTLNESLFREDFDDDKYTASRYLDVEVPDICAKVLEMLDVLPSHKAAYITKICRDFYAKLESIISSYTMTNESLHEDVTDVVTDTLAGPTEGPESGLASLLNTAVQDEFKTIQMYNDIAVSARAEGFEDIATVVDEINTEENKHVGQLQELLKTVSPNAKAIDTGEIEGQQQIGGVTDIVEEDLNNSNSSPNNNIEEDDNVMKESWEEVYQSFKTIEKELKGDGEAITATIDQLYRDNKGNPDYEKAYKKWASGE